MKAWTNKHTRSRGYEHIFTVLSIFGLQITKRSLTQSTLWKCLSFPLVCLVVAALVYTLPMLLRLTVLGLIELRLLLPSVITCFFCYTSWYLLFKKRFKLRAHLDGLEKLSIRIASGNRNGRSVNKRKLKRSKISLIERNARQHPRRFTDSGLNRFNGEPTRMISDENEKDEFDASNRFSDRALPFNGYEWTLEARQDELFSDSNEYLSRIQGEFQSRSERSGRVIPHVRDRDPSVANQSSNFIPSKSRILNLLLFLFVCSQILYPFIVVYITFPYDNQSHSVFTFGLYPGNEYLAFAIVVFGNFAYFLHVMCFPGLCSLAMSTVYVRLTDVLTAYRLKLEAIPPDQETRLIECVRDYSYIARLVIRTGELLSSPVTIIVTIDLLLMFNSVASFLLMDLRCSFDFVVEISFVLSFSSTSVLLLCFTASSVHDETDSLASCFDLLHEKALVFSSLPPRHICLIKAMAEKDIEPMSAAGTVFFTRGYILSIIGGFFSYALLFINIKTSASEEPNVLECQA